MLKLCKICKKQFESDDARRVVCSKSCRGKSARSAQKTAGRKPIHGGCIGGKLSPLYRRWCGIRARCLNKNYHNYHRYGGRGILICKEWESFASFESWAKKSGFKQNLQIDRIDNELGYSPQNCRWVEPVVNCNNKSDSIKLPNSLTITLVAKALGMTRHAIRQRINSGWPIEIAISMPKIPNGVARSTLKIRTGKWVE